MLKSTAAFSSFSVDEMEKAKQFYSETLGVKVKEIPEGMQLDLIEAGKVFIYAKPNHAPATYTVLNFIVDDIDVAADALIASGVTFEQYDSEYLKTDDKGINRNDSDMGPKAMGWFRDPAGNILAIMQE